MVPSGSSLGKGEHRRKETDWSFACLAFMCVLELSCLAADADAADAAAAAADAAGGGYGNDDDNDDGDDGDDDSFTVSEPAFPGFHRVLMPISSLGAFQVWGTSL